MAAYSHLDELRRLVANLPPEIIDKIREQTEMLVGGLATTVRARAEAQASMTDLCSSAGLPAGANASVLVHGAAAQQILELEDDEDCDLIVAGRQGKSRTADILLGSVSRRLLAESEADVLVVP